MNIDVGPTDNCDEGRFAENIATTLDEAFMGQIHDVSGNRRATDSEPSRYCLLRQHGILADQGEYLLFATGHSKQMLVA